MESGQPDRNDSQRPSAQFLPADAVISSEVRLTTRELYPERTAGPYSPDSHCQTGLLEGGAAIEITQVEGLRDDKNGVADYLAPRFLNKPDLFSYSSDEIKTKFAIH